MTSLVKGFFRLAAFLCLLLLSSGCALSSLAVPAAVSGGAAGVNYSVTNVASKTVSYPVADVEDALYKAFSKMRIKKVRRSARAGVVSVVASTSRLDIDIDLEKVTPTVTNIKVNAKKGLFLKDKATATEIIGQTVDNLEGGRRE